MLEMWQKGQSSDDVDAGVGSKVLGSGILGLDILPQGAGCETSQ